MNKKTVLEMFRTRLADAIAAARTNPTRLARETGVDRSAVTQFLAPDETRLPRADTLAALAQGLNVSADWLIGLSGDARTGAAVLRESLEVAEDQDEDVSAHLRRWHAEAAGLKIRYSPSNLPDLMKTEAVLKCEFDSYAARSAPQALDAAKDRLDSVRRRRSDFEVAIPRQRLEGFARGEGFWGALPAADRDAQLATMRALTEELYPALRLHIYDGAVQYAAAYTVFGARRAAMFIGQMYLVFNTADHVRVLTEHFDALVRAAVIHAHDAASYLEELRAQVGD